MLLFAALVIIALAVPFGTALTLERSGAAPVAVSVQHAPLDLAGPVAPQPLTEAVMLMLTGCLLIAIAAVVRRS